MNRDGMIMDPLGETTSGSFRGSHDGLAKDLVCSLKSSNEYPPPINVLSGGQAIVKTDCSGMCLQHGRTFALVCRVALDRRCFV